MRSCREPPLDAGRTRWWWYLGAPLGIAAGAVVAVWLRTSGSDALTLGRGEKVDAAFTARLDPPPSREVATPGGRFLLVVFGYTSCPDVCPTTLLAVHRALNALGASAERVVPIFVTVDPDRDTAEHLRTYTASFDPRIRSLSDPAVAAATLRAFHARAERRNAPSGAGYSMDHTAALYLLDPARRVVAALPENSPTLDDDLVKALRGDPAFGH